MVGLVSDLHKAIPIARRVHYSRAAESGPLDYAQGSLTGFLLAEKLSRKGRYRSRS